MSRNYLFRFFNRYDEVSVILNCRWLIACAASSLPPLQMKCQSRCDGDAVENLMIESESLRFWVSMLCHQPGNEIPEFMFHLVPIYSLILFVITQAFHIFYSDQTELISVILSWSSLWVNPKEYSTRSRNVLAYDAKCFPQCFRQGNVFLWRSWKLFLHAHGREMLVCYFLSLS